MYVLRMPLILGVVGRLFYCGSVILLCVGYSCLCTWHISSFYYSAREPDMRTCSHCSAKALCMRSLTPHLASDAILQSPIFDRRTAKHQSELQGKSLSRSKRPSKKKVSHLNSDTNGIVRGCVLPATSIRWPIRSSSG